VSAWSLNTIKKKSEDWWSGSGVESLPRKCVKLLSSTPVLPKREKNKCKINFWHDFERILLIHCSVKLLKTSF
jgi:hypothetical protein